MHQRKDEGSKKRAVLANKINAIFTGACGIARSPSMAFGGFGISRDEEKEFGNGGSNRPVSGTREIQVHAGKTCIKVTCQRPPIIVASAILTKKWKTSLKRVKLKLKGGDVKSSKAKTGSEEMELCKKRILMGEKCKALNLSGVLHYDKQGIILPEE